MPESCTPLFDPDEIYKKLADENAIVFVDSQIVDDSLQLFFALQVAKSKTYIVHHDENGARLIQACPL